MEKTQIIDACENLYASISASIDNLHKLRDVFFEKSELLNNTLAKINEEFKYNEYIENIRPDIIKIWDFLEQNDWIKFQTILYHYYSELLGYEPGSMAYPDFLSTRETVEHLMIEQTSDNSVYTRIVNTLKIPVGIIPRKFVKTFFNSDEFMGATNAILKVIHDTMRDPKSFPSADAFRSYTEELAEGLNNELTDKGYYGTYEKLYLTELMMAYRLGNPGVGPLYITSEFPKNENKYEDLKKFVDKLWEAYEQPRDKPGDS